MANQTSAGVWSFAKRTADRRFPGAYAFARKLRDKAAVEVRVLRQMGVRGLMQLIAPKRADWRKELPVQGVLRFAIAASTQPARDDIRPWLESLVGPVAAGQHTVYLTPDQLKRGPFAHVGRLYPEDSGMKILRTSGSANSANYVRGADQSEIQRRALGSPRWMSVVANRFSLEGVGPRLYDVVELAVADTVWTAFVTQHVSQNADPKEAEACVARLKQLVHSGELSLIAPSGFQHPDFLPPEYGRNIGADSEGKGLYFDFQNFQVADHGQYISKLARAAAEDTHFGEKSLLRGGKYLYQAVPGITASGKRNVHARMRVIDQLLKESRVDLNGRIVLDFGSNIGMMMAEYLRRGAHWCVGWDLPTTVVHSEKLLQAVGCTRFSLVPGKLGPDAPVLQSMPSFIKPQLDRCVVSYLAVRGHFGWLPVLTNIPWQHLIYEGHEGEPEAVSKAHLSNLAALVPFDILGCAMYDDGDSRPRFVAILQRRPDAADRLG